MGFTTFLFSGPKSTKLDPYRPEHYSNVQKDTIIAEKTTHLFAGKKDFEEGIGFYGDNKDRRTWRTEYVIDGAIRVNTIHTDVVKDAKAFWGGLSKRCKIAFTVTLIVGICAIGGAIAAGIISGWPLALAITAIALIALGLAALSLYRKTQTKDQLKEWKLNDTVSQTIKERIEVGLQGFHYAHAKNLKGSIVTADELKSLWYQEMQGYSQSFEIGAPSDTIRSFMERSPLATSAFDYALNHAESAPIKIFNTRYEAQIKPIYIQIRMATKRQEDEVNAERNNRLNVVQQRCNAEVDIMKKACNNAINPSRLKKFGLIALRASLRSPDPRDRNYDAKMQAYNREYDQYTRQIDAFDAEIRGIELSYDQQIASIKAKYESEKIQVNADADSKIRLIIDQESKNLVTLLNSPIQTLLKDFNSREKKQTPVVASAPEYQV